MFNLLLKTIVVYFSVVFSMRVMGKRQLAQLQPYDLVVALMIAEVASTPLDTPGTPLLHGILPALCLIVLYTLIAQLTIKSKKIITFFDGIPTLVISHGVILQKALKKNDYSLTDLIEGIRLAGYESPFDIEYAILETSGNLSVFPKPAAAPVTQKDLQLVPKRKPPALPLVLDGQIQQENLRIARLEQDALLRALDRAGVELRCAFFVAFSDPRTLLIQLPGGHQTHVTVKCHD